MRRLRAWIGFAAWLRWNLPYLFDEYLEAQKPLLSEEQRRALVRYGNDLRWWIMEHRKYER